jgi:hypothetical protein
MAPRSAWSSPSRFAARDHHLVFLCSSVTSPRTSADCDFGSGVRLDEQNRETPQRELFSLDSLRPLLLLFIVVRVKDRYLAHLVPLVVQKP